MNKTLKPVTVLVCEVLEKHGDHSVFKYSEGNKCALVLIISCMDY